VLGEPLGAFPLGGVDLVSVSLEVAHDLAPVIVLGCEWGTSCSATGRIPDRKCV
jgi:hypothetical protein